MINQLPPLKKEEELYDFETKPLVDADDDASLKCRQQISYSRDEINIRQRLNDERVKMTSSVVTVMMTSQSSQL